MAVAQPQVGRGHPIGNVRRHVGPQFASRTSDKAIAQANQVVANVDRRAGSMPTMQGLLAIAVLIVVLDVVMHQRGLVKGLDRHGDLAHRVGKPRQRLTGPRRSRLSAGDRIVRRQGDEWTKPLASMGQPLVGDRLGDCQCRFQVRWCPATPHARQQFVESALEQVIRGPHQRNITDGGLSRGLFKLLQHIPNPRLIKRRVLAVTRVQGNRVRRNPGDQHLVDRLLEHVQARNPQDRVDVARHNDLQNNRRALGHKHLVTQLLSPNLVIGDRAGSALLAIEPEFVVIGRAPFGVLQAVRQQQHPPMKRDRQELLLPEEIPDQHHRKTEELFRKLQAIQQIPSVALQFVLREGL